MATVVCDQHGLRFDPERADGCVICRRERGAAPPAERPAAPAAAAGGLPVALAWTVAIWLLGGALLYLAHDQVVETFRPDVAAGAWEGAGAPDESGAAPDEELAEPADDGGGG
jgi:hypothetical protein